MVIIGLSPFLSYFLSTCVISVWVSVGLMNSAWLLLCLDVLCLHLLGPRELCLACGTSNVFFCVFATMLFDLWLASCAAKTSLPDVFLSMWSLSHFLSDHVISEFLQHMSTIYLSVWLYDLAGFCLALWSLSGFQSDHVTLVPFPSWPFNFWLVSCLAEEILPSAYISFTLMPSAKMFILRANVAAMLLNK